VAQSPLGGRSLTVYTRVDIGANTLQPFH